MWGWLKHHGNQIMFWGCIGYSILLAVTGLIPELSPAGWPLLALFVAGQVGVLLHEHKSEWCIRCATDYDRNHATGEQQALRHMASLKYVHSVLLVLTNFLIFMLLIVVGRATGQGTWFLILAMLLAAVEWRHRFRHQRLKPWCPWCKDHNDGDDTMVPDPDPSMAKER